MGEQLALDLDFGIPDVEVVRGHAVRMAVRCVDKPWRRVYLWRRGRMRRVRDVRVRMRGVL